MNKPKKMKAAVTVAEKKIDVENFEIPTTRSGEVLIKINSCLICTWEQRIFTGESSVDYPFISGHEASGEVVEIPSGTVTNFDIGDKVVFKTLDHCGHCYFCYQGYDNQCIGNARKRYYTKTEDNVEVPGSGGLAQYISLPVERVFPIESNISLEKAAFAEPLACCIHSIKRGNIKLGDKIIINGAGIMGQLHAILARMKGGIVTVVEPKKERRDLAKRLGAHNVVDPNSKEGEKYIKAMEGKIDLVVNTVPITEVAEKVMNMLNKMGKIIFYASFHPNKDIKIDPNYIHYSEISITGSSGPATTDFLQATRLINNEIIQVEEFISEKYPLTEINKALEVSLEPDAYRILISLN